MRILGYSGWITSWNMRGKFIYMLRSMGVMVKGTNCYEDAWKFRL